MNPVLIFLLLFIAIPLTELYFLIEIGARIGAFATLFLTVFTALLGGWMVRFQGFSTLLRVRRAMEGGEMPAFEMLEGAVLLVCGVLLLLPGFITDIVGFVFLVPAVRRWLLSVGLQSSGILRPGFGATPGQDGERRVIEGEFQRDEDKPSSR